MRFSGCTSVYALVALCACAGASPAEVDHGAANLAGVWEARVDKPFEANDPEKFVFEVFQNGAELRARACELRRANGEFEGKVLSFACGSETSSIDTDSSLASIAFTTPDGGALEMALRHWEDDDTISGDAYVQEWAEFGRTPLLAKRVPEQDLP